jgi:hypothetical protein
MSAFVASCFSGSSTQSSTPRKVPKRLDSPAEGETATPSSTTTTAPADNTSTAGSTEAGTQSLRTLYVNVASANVRSMPSTGSTIVGKLKFLDPVGATGMLDGEWVQVEITMADGALGKAWVHSTLVSASKEQAEAVKAAAGNK